MISVIEFKGLNPILSLLRFHHKPGPGLPVVFYPFFAAVSGQFINVHRNILYLKPLEDKAGFSF